MPRDKNRRDVFAGAKLPRFARERDGAETAHAARPDGTCIGIEEHLIDCLDTIGGERCDLRFICRDGEHDPRRGRPSLKFRNDEIRRRGERMRHIEDAGAPVG